jgi:hypothetical protein
MVETTYQNSFTNILRSQAAIICMFYKPLHEGHKLHHFLYCNGEKGDFNRPTSLLYHFWHDWPPIETPPPLRNITQITSAWLFSHLVRFQEIEMDLCPFYKSINPVWLTLITLLLFLFHFWHVWLPIAKFPPPTYHSDYLSLGPIVI